MALPLLDDADEGIRYFAIGLHGGAAHFFKFLIYLFLGVFAAESQSMLIAATIPIFVAALAIAAFVNGLWMVVQGYFIRATSLPRFWYYSAHFIDFQTFAFEILVKNDVQGLEFSCPVIAGVCSCPFASTVQTATNCAVSGDDLLLVSLFPELTRLDSDKISVPWVRRD